jgi:hypothetical protein
MSLHVPIFEARNMSDCEGAAVSLHPGPYPAGELPDFSPCGLAV